MEKKLILIVDDESDVLRLVKFGLEKHGYNKLTVELEKVITFLSRPIGLNW